MPESPHVCITATHSTWAALEDHPGVAIGPECSSTRSILGILQFTWLTPRLRALLWTTTLTGIVTECGWRPFHQTQPLEIILIGSYNFLGNIEQKHFTIFSFPGLVFQLSKVACSPGISWWSPIQILIRFKFCAVFSKSVKIGSNCHFLWLTMNKKNDKKGKETDLCVSIHGWLVVKTWENKERII